MRSASRSGPAGSDARERPSGYPAAPTSSGAPPLPCAPGASPFHIKGIALRGLATMIERRVPGGLDAFVAALDDARLGPFVRQPFLAASLYDLLPVLPLDALLAKLLGTSLASLARAQGIAQARYDGTHVYKLIVSRGSLDDLDQRLPRLGAQYYDFGTYDARVVGPGHVVVRRGGMPAYVIPWFSPMHGGYAEELVRMLGAREAHGTVREVRSSVKAGFEVVDTETHVEFA